MATRRNAGQVSLRLSLEDGETVRRALQNIGVEGDRALRAIERAAPDASSGLSLVDEAVQGVTGRLDGLAGSAGGVGRMLGSAGPFGLAAAAAVGTVLSLATATLRAAEQISNLRREAERAGQSFESFQELAVIANRTGIEVDALADGMRELQLRADEFVQTGTGSGEEAFERLGFDRASVQAALTDVDGFFDDVMARIGELDRAAQIRVLDELFGGTAGEQFMRLLDEGVDSMEAMRQAARDTGQVLSEEVGREAEALRRSYDEAANILKVRMQEALTNLMPLMTSLVEGAGRFLGLINQVVDALGDARSGMTLQELQAERASLVDQAGRATNARSETNASRQIADIDRRIAELQRAQLVESYRLRVPSAGVQPIVDEDDDAGAGSSAVDRQRERLERLAEAYRRDLAGAVGIYEGAMAEVNALVEANLLTQEEGLRLETQLRETLTQTLEKERQARLAAATDPVSGAVRALEAIEEQAFDSASLIEEALTGAFSGLEDAMVEFATTGKFEIGDLVDSILADVARLATRQLITGPLSQLLSGALGGLTGGGASLFPFADGGIMTSQGPLPVNAYSMGGIASSPQVAVYGEGRMNEAYVPLPDGRTIPVTMQGAGAGGLVELVVRLENNGDLTAQIERTAGDVAVRVVNENNRQQRRQDRLK